MAFFWGHPSLEDLFMEHGTMQCFYFVSFQVHTGTTIWDESYFQKLKHVNSFIKDMLNH